MSLHIPETATTSIIAGPLRANTSDGNWSVRLRKDYPSGARVEYGKQFFRKHDALAFIADCGLADRRQGGAA